MHHKLPFITLTEVEHISVNSFCFN